MKIFGPISCIWTWNETRPLEKSKDVPTSTWSLIHFDCSRTRMRMSQEFRDLPCILRLINAFYYLRFLPQPHWVKSPIQYQPFTHCNRCLYQYKISWNLQIMVIFSVLQNMENKWWNVRSCCNFYKCIFIHTRARAHERERALEELEWSSTFIYLWLYILSDLRAYPFVYVSSLL